MCKWLHFGVPTRTSVAWTPSRPGVLNAGSSEVTEGRPRQQSCDCRGSAAHLPVLQSGSIVLRDGIPASTIGQIQNGNSALLLSLWNNGTLHFYSKRNIFCAFCCLLPGLILMKHNSLCFAIVCAIETA